jgi:hypothetical protein
MMLNRIARVLPILGLLLIPGEPSADSIEKPPLRPLILIPGILGSSLVNSSEQFVWRGFNDLLSRFDELEYSSGSRSILHSNDIMRTDFLLGAWKTGSYESILEILREWGCREGKDLFIFHYDWRQSNFVTAEQLQQFITEHTLMVKALTFLLIAWEV